MFYCSCSTKEKKADYKFLAIMNHEWSVHGIHSPSNTPPHDIGFVMALSPRTVSFPKWYSQGHCIFFFVCLFCFLWYWGWNPDLVLDKLSTILHNKSSSTTFLMTYFLTMTHANYIVHMKPKPECHNYLCP